MPTNDVTGHRIHGRAFWRAPCDEAVTCSCGVFIIAGRNGLLSSSINGTTWAAQTSQFGGTSDIEGAAWGPVPGYGNGIFVIVGESGKLAVTDIVTDWFLETSSFGSTTINAVTWASSLGIFVAVGEAGSLATSNVNDWPDTWTQQTTGFGTDNIYAIVWSPELDLFVIGGTFGTLATSPDGVTWTLRTSNTDGSNIGTACWSPDLGLFIIGAAGGELCTSSDGTTWTQQTSGFSGSSIESSAWSSELGLFVIVGDAGKVATSPDGTTWTARTSGFGTTLITAAAWSSELGLFTIAGSAGKIATSPDGIDWTARVSGFGTTNIRAIAVGTPCMIDDFGRADDTGWGTASRGFGWDYDPTAGSIVSGRGVLSSSADEVGTNAAITTDPAEIDFGFDFQFDALPGSGTYSWVAAPGNAARAEVHLGAASGDSKIRLEFIGGDSPAPVEVALPALDTGVWRCRLFTNLTSLKLKVWPVADPEPSAWMATIATASPTYDPNPLYLYWTLNDTTTVYFDNMAFTCPEPA